MTPVAFEQANVIFDHPDPEVLPINACVAEVNDMPALITCWKLTIDEVEEFKRTGRIYLIFYGEAMPIHSVSAINPFKE